MTKRMLIDTTHAEETRVVVLDGNRLDDYDVETSAKKQLKGNIYLAKIVRIEPSLQAAFVEYGGNRHGFLAFSEIHPDYYQIPVADRERLIALQEEEARAEEARADREDEENERAARDGDDSASAEHDAAPDAGIDIGADTHPDVPATEAMLPATPDASSDEPASGDDRPVIEMPLEIEAETVVAESDAAQAADGEHFEDGDEQHGPAPETVSGESSDDGHAQRRTARFLRQYKIQEVMRRRQIILVQVVKEERGNKGAALTTYISLAGRFSVLMPNSPRGGGVSRKITSAADRRRLKEITQELEIPRGMGMIVRTAGAQRPRAEIRRDGEYLLRTWDDIRETTLASTAPCLVYEEASLIKRAIRDVYTRDVEEIVVDGEAGWKSAREFMRMLMPANANKVSLWRDGSQTLFGHHGVEHHLDAMLQPTVQLRSGGYLVINQTEALVAIDVNSGRSTRERGIEETAFRTNMEAADEVARQLRLRDLAGLIVIDFIDMEVRRNNAAVERRLKDALRNDRARIQVGSISHFGLLEMSRQRLRPSIAESSFVTCPHCAGTGFVRGTESSALHVLRAIEEEAGKRKASEILVHVAGPVALYVLNHKRTWLGEIEARYGLTVHLAADDSLLPPNLRIDRIRPYLPPATPASYAPAQQTAAVTNVPIAAAAPPSLDPFEQDETVEAGDEAARPAAQQTDGSTASEGDENGRRRKRRRRRRGGRRENGPENGTENGVETGSEQNEHESDQDEGDDDAETTPVAAEADAAPSAEPVATERTETAEGDNAPRGRRRRGGRNRNRQHESESGHEQTENRPAQRAYNGPTPADPFAGSFDIFEMMDRDADEMDAVAAQAPVQTTPPVAQPVAAEPVVEAPQAEPVIDTVPVAETASEPVAAETVETADAIPADAEAPVSETPVTETKARKPRAPRKPKAAATATTKEKPAKAAAAVAPEAVAEAEASDAAPAKPKRKAPARSRKTAAKAVEAATETVAAPEAAPDAAPVEAAPEATAAPAPVAEAAAPAATEVDPSIVQPRVIGDAAPPATRRTGWWKR